MSCYVNMMGKSVIGAFIHSERECAYDELKILIYRGMTIEKDGLEYISYLKGNGFPEKYGLIECCLIVREHNNELCKKVMADWWNEFVKHECKRDQPGFIYALYKNGITVEDVQLSANNIYKDYTVRHYKWHR